MACVIQQCKYIRNLLCYVLSDIKIKSSLVDDCLFIACCRIYYNIVEKYWNISTTVVENMLDCNLSSSIIYLSIFSVRLVHQRRHLKFTLCSFFEIIQRTKNAVYSIISIHMDKFGRF
jgi:hypothetical protein